MHLIGRDEGFGCGFFPEELVGLKAGADSAEFSFARSARRAVLRVALENLAFGGVG